jgi:hypothetical protein
MKKIFILTSLCLATLLSLNAQNNASFGLAVLQYRGGGDWYANPTSVPNLAKFCEENLGMKLSEPAFVDVGSPDIFNYPWIHMTGHGNVVFNNNDIENLRAYLLAGGFLHIDDNYGLDPFIRPQLKKLFPDNELVEVPFDHPIYLQKFPFNKGLPKVHEHDGLAPQGFGIFHEGRIVLFYSYESDLGNGWEDPEVHGDPEETRLKALKMGANLVMYALMGQEEAVFE